MDAPTQPRARRRYTIALVWLAALAVFALTAYPTVTWWESSVFSLAAPTLGVTPPPGSLLLTLIGWLVTRLPTGLPVAHALNLLAAVLAATTVALGLVIALRLLRRPGAAAPAPDRASETLKAGAAAGALTFAFSATLWQYATQVNPYVLTSVFTGLILWTMLRWWDSAADEQAWRWLLLLGLLFGLDYSVHRTNALLLPGALVWIMIRRPRTLRSARSWLAGAGGLVAGAALQLLVIPMAAAHPVLNIGDPSTWSRFYSYESLAQFSGAPFLVQFYPRHAALWSVQALDFIRAFKANFVWLSGPWGILGILPALLGIVGWLALWRRERRLAVAFGVVLMLHAVMTVAYFNIPAHFFRTFDRHYLPVFVTWAVLVCCGAGVVADRLRRATAQGGRRVVRWSPVVLVLAPLSQLGANGRAEDASHRTFTEDFAANLLGGLPPDAILFTWGDNDTFPLMYMQAVAHVRPDVRIANLSLLNTPWYVDELTRADPSFPLPRGWKHPGGIREWRDTTVVIPVAGEAAQLGLPAGTPPPRSVAVRVGPTVMGKYVLPQDLVLLQILETNQWRRPLCFSGTSTTPGLPGLAPYARMDGIFWRVVPRANPAVDREALRRTLRDTYVYRGYADSRIPLDDMSRNLGRNYYAPLAGLLEADHAAGEDDQCRRDRDAALRALPFSRLEPDAAQRHAIDTACSGSATAQP